jgi:hypothetical protein
MAKSTIVIRASILLALGFLFFGIYNINLEINLIPYMTDLNCIESLKSSSKLNGTVYDERKKRADHVCQNYSKGQIAKQENNEINLSFFNYLLSQNVSNASNPRALKALKITFYVCTAKV